MPWWKQPKFYLNIIGLLVNIGQYFLTNHYLPQYAVYITIIIGVLQIVSNTIAAMVQNDSIKAMLTTPKK